ncbi:MAG TPA: TPM domain-containing protein [Candidatus Acidoferrum sp.]|nr:TPM domain-containing protein [Candidatus Acidoferrum sp.]
MRVPAAKFFFTVFLLAIALQFSQSPITRAEDISKIQPSDYVIDLTGTLDSATKNSLDALCLELEQKTGAQMAIVTVHDFQDESVENYAADLYKHLGIGSKKDDRGVLLLVSPDQRKYRIEVGYGLEPVINDARAGDAGRAMVPYLRANDYNRAIQVAAWQLGKYVADDRGVTLTGAPPVPVERPVGNNGNIGGGFAILLFLIVIVFFFVMASRVRGAGGSGCLWFLLGMLVDNVGSGGSYRGGGFGGSSGGFGGGGGGGFGGFGGGSSGGGGASGSW